jgi:hypothetical protein
VVGVLEFANERMDAACYGDKSDASRGAGLLLPTVGWEPANPATHPKPDSKSYPQPVRSKLRQGLKVGGN